MGEPRQNLYLGEDYRLLLHKLSKMERRKVSDEIRLLLDMRAVELGVKPVEWPGRRAILDMELEGG